MPELDYIDERVQRKRQLVFGILIALIIISSIIYYFWGNLINRGTVLIYAKPPFTVDFYDIKQTFNCKESPCKINQKAGNKSFTIIKDGYEPVLSSVNIKLNDILSLID